MPAEAGHHPNLPYFDQATGSLHLNGSTMYDSAEQVIGTTATSGLSQLGICRVLYDFAVDGGLVSAIVPASAVALPAKAIVLSAYAHVLTLFTGGGGATIALSIEGANDIRTAATITTGGFDSTGMKALIPVGTAATAVVCTVARKLTLSVAVAALTAGKAVFYLTYVVSQ
jgi:hypothetical protein